MQLYDYEQKHLERVRKNAAECTLFLKTSGDFPLEEAGQIAVYGSGARKTIKGGTGSGEVNSRFSVTIEEGLENAGFTVTTKKWLDTYDRIRKAARAPWVEKMKKEAKAAHTNVAIYAMGAVMPEPAYDISLDGEGDVAIYVLSRISGEGSDRNPVPGDIELSQTEIRDITALAKKYPKFMLVLNVGGAVDLSPVVDQVKDVLLLSQLGVVTGDLFADILLGKAYPSGKLATTWSAWKDYPDFTDFGDWDDTRYREGIYVGYRYFDSVGKKALFPFGFGLGYTTFAGKNTEIHVDGTRVSVTAEIRNTGKHPGKEVFEVYVSSPEGKLDKPYQALAAFTKTDEIAPDASYNAVAEFDMASLASYDAQRSAWILEPGDYIVRGGNSSVNTDVAGVITLDREVIVEQDRAELGETDFEDWKPEKKPAAEVPADAVRIALSADAFTTRKVEYDQPVEIDPWVKERSDEELAHINMGQFDPKAGLASVIGQASDSCPGAAGETTSFCKDEGLPALVLSDGPAGIRVNPKYVINDDGKAEAYGANPLMDSMTDMLPKVVLAIMKHASDKAMRRIEKSGKPIHEHYATAIPIGTAIAQTWNAPLAEDWGDLVGEEMELFGIHLWLAPALNIHRSIRCGRNFEYYSEDPLIAGTFAAAITNGVQKHPGCGTTIKHYAANNQETNRYANNSIVSERAMREIYLRGFGIAVKESQPHAVMTSYNLLNGTHTSCRKDLIEDVLRAEFGYKGIVMTDWVVPNMPSKKGKYQAPDPADVAAAGNDLFMPASQSDYKMLMNGFKSGKVSRDDLERNATRVVAKVHELYDAHVAATLFPQE